MVRRARKPAFATTSVFVMALILLLGSIGVVNGLWSKNLIVDGTVETGDLVARWDKIRTHDLCDKTNTTEATTQSDNFSAQTESFNSEGGYDGHDNEPDPCQSNPCGTDSRHSDTCSPKCEGAIGGVGDDASFGNQVAYVDIENATPGYWCEVKGWVSNLGTIPFDIVGVNGILDAKNDKGLTFYDLNGDQPGTCKLVDKYGHPTDDRQVDPKEDGIVYCKVVIDQSMKTCKSWHHDDCAVWEYTDGAKDGWTYHFAIEVCVAQWNEDPSSGGQQEDFAACKHPASGTHEGPDTPVLPTPGANP